MADVVGARHYRTVQDRGTGRWLVVHDLPGADGVYAIDCDCLTQGAATLEASFLESARRAQLQQERDERLLAGVQRHGAAA